MQVDMHANEETGTVSFGDEDHTAAAAAESARHLSFKTAVLAASTLGASCFEKSLACTATHVRQQTVGTITKPIAAFHCHYKLGSIWQHGEVLIAYRTKDGAASEDEGWRHHLDVFDRIGVKKTSAMKAFFMTSTKRKLLPHNIRAHEASPARGLDLHRKYTFDHLNLEGADIDAVHAAISIVVRSEHGVGFSYATGHHCQEFSSDLFVALKSKLGGDIAEKDVPRLNVCNSCCCLPCSSRPTLDVFMGEHYPDMLADFEAQEKFARTASDP